MKTRQERREKRQMKKRFAMPKHGKGMAQQYKNIVSKSFCLNP